LQKVEKDKNALWFIEKKLRKRKRTGKIQWLVKFEGWPDKYNQWINEEDITEPQNLN
jgi:vacuolar-type H+-ATPase catalytic subunit A/Vma1